MRYDVTFHPQWWNINAGICFDEKFFFDPEYRMKVDCKMQKTLFEHFGEFGLGQCNPRKRPILWTDLLASGFVFSAMSGCKIKFSDGNAPEVICANISDEQLFALDIKIALKSDWWLSVLDQAAYLTKRYGFVESHINLQGVQNIALDLRGQRLFEDYYGDKIVSDYLLYYCLQLLIETGRILSLKSQTLSAGVTPIAKKVFPNGYIHSNCTVELLSSECYRKNLLGVDNALSACFSPYGIHHCGQSMEHVCDEYAKIDDLKFAEVGAGSDIERVCRTLPPKVIINLRYSPVKLKNSTPEQIKNDVNDMVKKAMPRKKLSMSCVGIDTEVSDQQVIAFLSAVKAQI